jgi:hypothetical protein
MAAEISHQSDMWTEIWRNFIAPMTTLLFSGAIAWNATEQRRIARENQSRETTHVLLQVYGSVSGLFSSLLALKDSLTNQQCYTRNNLTNDKEIPEKYSASVAATKSDYKQAFRQYNSAKLLAMVIYGIHDKSAPESFRARAVKVKQLLDRFGGQALLFRRELDLDPGLVENRPAPDDEEGRTRLACLVRAEMDLLNTLSADMRYHLPEPGSDL